MDARLLDVLHRRRHVDALAVAERVDVDLDRVLDEAVDEDGAVHLPLERVTYVLGAVADPHRAAAEHVRRPDEHGVADPRRGLDRVLPGRDDLPCGTPNPESLEQAREPLPVLGEVDRVERRAHDPEPARLERAREP